MTTHITTTLFAASLMTITACATTEIDRDESVVGTWELHAADGTMVEQMQLTADGAIAIAAGELLVGNYEANGDLMRLEFAWPGGTTSYEFTYAATSDALARIAMISLDGDADPVGRYSGTYRITSELAAGSSPTIVHFDYQLELEDGGRAILLTTTNTGIDPSAVIGSWSMRADGSIELLATDGVVFELAMLPTGDLGMNGIDGWGNSFGVFQRAR